MSCEAPAREACTFSDTYTAGLRAYPSASLTATCGLKKSGGGKMGGSGYFAHGILISVVAYLYYYFFWIQNAMHLSAYFARKADLPLLPNNLGGERFPRDTGHRHLGTLSGSRCAKRRGVPSEETG